MRKRVQVLLAALSLCATATAQAADKKDTLYVKARNTRLMASAAPTANVLAILQPGQQVTWLGADPKHKQWHRVRVKEKGGTQEGLVFQSNLSTKPPSMELTASSGRKVDSTAFANSGAAVKGLSSGAISYGNGKKDPDLSGAVKQLQALEQVAGEITPEEIAAHAATARLFPVVGPQDTVSRGGK